MGTDVFMWRVVIEMFNFHYRPLRISVSLPTTFFCYDKIFFKNCFCISVVIFTILMISGVELNPRMTTRSISSTESSNANAAPDINESLLKLFNELTTFKNE